VHAAADGAANVPTAESPDGPDGLVGKPEGPDGLVGKTEGEPELSILAIAYHNLGVEQASVLVSSHS
jgi:hypothetical protein